MALTLDRLAEKKPPRLVRAAVMRSPAGSRVEDGRGGCALKSPAPFPVPAHQTGRADFQHPAFRLTLPYDPRRASIVRAHKMQDRKFSKHIAKGEP